MLRFLHVVFIARIVCIIKHPAKRNGVCAVTIIGEEGQIVVQSGVS